MGGTWSSMGMGSLGGADSGSSWQDVGLGGSTSKAVGGVIIDVSQLMPAAVAVAKVSKEMTNSFTNLDRAIVKTEKNFQTSAKSIENDFKSLNKQTQLFGNITSGLLGAAAPAAAFKISTNFARLELLMKRLIGSEIEAQKEMEKLKEFSRDAAQPYDDILHAATSILPLLRGTNVELTDAVSLITRLSALDPMQGISGASVAVKEILSDEYLSLVRRFELDRNRLKTIRNESGGDPTKIMELLNEYLTEIGYGPDMLAEMEKAGVGTFDSMLSEIRILIDEGFRPLRDEYILPLIRLVRDLAKAMQDVDPDLLSAIIGGGSILSAGAGASRFLGPGAMQAGILGATGIGAIEGGTGLVRVAANELGRTGTGLDRFKGTSQDEAKDILWNDFKNVVKILAVGLIEVNQQLTIFNYTVANVIKGLVENFDELFSLSKDIVVKSFELLGVQMELGFTNILKSIMNVIASVFSGLEKIEISILGKEIKPFSDLGLDKLSEDILGLSDAISTTDLEAKSTQLKNELGALTGELTSTITASAALTEEQQAAVAANTELQKSIMGIPTEAEKAAAMMDRLRSITEKFAALEALPELGFTPTEEQFQAFLDYKDALKEAEEETNQEILEVNEEYQKDLLEMEKEFTDERTELIDEFNLEQKRKQEDYLRKRREIENEQVDDSIERQYEYQKTITEINEEANQSQIDAANEYYEALEELQQKYLLDLNEAASQLDVSKVIDLQQQYELDTDKLTDSFQEEQATIEANRQKRLEEERITLNEVLNENIKNRDERLRQLDEENAIRQQREAEDFMIDLERMSEEHNQELAKRQEQHQETLAELANELEEQKQTILDKYIETHDKIAEAEGQHQSMMLGVQRQGLKNLEAEFKAFWQRTRAQNTARPITNTVANAITNAANSIFPTFATGGQMYRTGLAKLEKGEQVLRPDAAAVARSLMGNDITPNSIRSLANSGSPNITISMQNSFGDVGNYSIDELERLFAKTVDSRVKEIFISQTRKF